MYYDLPMYVRMDVVCSATRRTRVSENQEVREAGEPCAVGDVVVGRVASVGRHGVIETVQGLERPIGRETAAAWSSGAATPRRNFSLIYPGAYPRGNGLTC